MSAKASDWDLTRKAIDMYLMTDGQTRWTSPLFEGDGPYKEFRNRDKRLYLTTYPPYVVDAPGNIKTWEHTGEEQDREYIDFMDSTFPNSVRNLPAKNWSGTVVRKMPHFRDNSGGQVFVASNTGYSLIKFANWEGNFSGKSNHDHSDAPIFRIEEVMLNYAEAKKELGEFNQAICDQTINRLRERAGVASLELANIPDDPKRDPSVDPEMWEIRRERAIELMGEGFRFDDLRRWKKMDYATERKLGMWINKSEEPGVPILDDADEGYVSYEGVPPTPYPDHYYLYPIPSNQILLTEGVVEQNPGWL
jgi:hypothetical protein